MVAGTIREEPWSTIMHVFWRAVREPPIQPPPINARSPAAWGWRGPGSARSGKHLQMRASAGGFLQIRGCVAGPVNAGPRRSAVRPCDGQKEYLFNPIKAGMLLKTQHDGFGFENENDQKHKVFK